MSYNRLQTPWCQSWVARPLQPLSHNWVGWSWEPYRKTNTGVCALLPYTHTVCIHASIHDFHTSRNLQRIHTHCPLHDTRQIYEHTHLEIIFSPAWVMALLNTLCTTDRDQADAALSFTRDVHGDIITTLYNSSASRTLLMRTPVLSFVCIIHTYYTHIYNCNV